MIGTIRQNAKDLISNTLALNPQAQAKQNLPESSKKQKIDE